MAQPREVFLWVLLCTNCLTPDPEVVPSAATLADAMADVNVRSRRPCRKCHERWFTLMRLTETNKAVYVPEDKAQALKWEEIQFSSPPASDVVRT